MTDDGAGITIVYDGDCPLCARYVRHMRLQQSAGPVQLVNAREFPELVRTYAGKGCSLEEGMVAEYGGRTYHGADCVHLLSVLSAREGWVNRCSAYVLRHRRVAGVVYPLLKAGRSLLLRLLCIPKIESDARSG